MKLKKVLPYLILVAVAVAYYAMNYDPMNAQVSGKVYWNKQVLELNDGQRGTVQFRPVSGGANCTGKIDPSGSYIIGTGGRDALIPGDYHISVSVMQIVPSEEEGGLPQGYIVTPSDYSDPVSSGLTYIVKSGENVHDIYIEGEASEPPAMEEVSEEMSPEEGSSEEVADSEETDPTASVDESEDQTSSELSDAQDEIVEEVTSETKEEVTE